MYDSPIKLFLDSAGFQINEQVENGVYEAVQHYGITVGKDELIRALRYDRGQYDKGYADGKCDAVKHGRWVWKDFHGDGSLTLCCSECLGTDWARETAKYCSECGAKMDLEVTNGLDQH